MFSNMLASAPKLTAFLQFYLLLIKYTYFGLGELPKTESGKIKLPLLLH